MSAANHTHRITIVGLALLAATVLACVRAPIGPTALSLSKLSQSALSKSALSISETSLPTVDMAELIHSAVILYGDEKKFGVPGTSNGQFKEPSGIAVNDATGNVYVYDAGNLRVEWLNSTGSKFEGQLNGSTSPTGQFAPPTSISEYAAHGTLFNLAIDNDPSSPSTSDVYVVDPGHNVIDKFSATGTYISQLTGFKAPIFGVAVDTSGDVWVEEEGNETGGQNHGPVQEFDDSLPNKHLKELPSLEGLRSPGIAVNPEQDLYLLRGGADIVKFDKEGNVLIPDLGNEGVTGLAIDTATNDLLADHLSAIEWYRAPVENGSSPQESIPGISSSYGVAVNGTAASHQLYATQREAGEITEYSLVSVPTAILKPVSEIHRTAVKLEGEVNPEGNPVTSCEFEYGTNTVSEHTAPCTPSPGSGTSLVPVSAEITSLTAQTTYHYRLLASNSHGAQRVREELEFTTPPAVENVLTEEAINVTGTQATLQGSFEPNGSDTHYRFEYEPIGEPPSFTPLEDAGSPNKDEKVNAQVNGLEPNAFYFYQILAENEFGQSSGGLGLFKTLIIPPTITNTPTTTFITAQSASLNVTLNPQHTTTHYHFEYGPCPTLTDCANIQNTPDETSAVYGQVGTTQEIVGLAPSTTYTFRLVASNEFEETGEQHHETVISAESKFTTGPAPTPSAQTGASNTITPTSAIISGTVNPDGLPASYAFELGIYNGASTQYGVVYSAFAGTSTTPTEETLQLAGLQPGTTYAYRIAVSSGYINNQSHTLQGEPATLTTPGLPTTLTPPPLLTQLPTPPIPFPNAPSSSKEKAKPKTHKHHKHKKTHKNKKKTQQHNMRHKKT
jgi:hypothetical protein